MLTPSFQKAAYLIVISCFPEDLRYFSSSSVSTPGTLLFSKICPDQHLEVSMCLASYFASTPSNYLFWFVSIYLLSVNYPFHWKYLLSFFDTFQLHHC